MKDDITTKNKKGNYFYYIFIAILLFTVEDVKAQQLSFEEELKIASADYGTCYIIENYSLCPENKLIRKEQMFGTDIVDCIGFFSDSTLNYEKDTMIIFGGAVFFDTSNFNIDWESVQLLSLYDRSMCVFTDGEFFYSLIDKKVTKMGVYDKHAYFTYYEKKQESNSLERKGLGENFHVEKGKLYFKDFEVLESFDVDNLQIIKSDSGYTTNFATDGKQVFYCGPTGGYQSIEKNDTNYVVVKRFMLDEFDLASLRVLGRNLLADRNAIYYRNNVIPFEELNGFNFIIREL